MEEKDIDDVCEYILKKLSDRDIGERWNHYPYFEMPNGELISDNGFDPMLVVSEFEKYGLSKPLDIERCELTELGVEIGKGIGFKKHKANEEKKKSKKETIEKRKNAMVNHNYWYTRPKNIISGIVILLTFIGLGTYKDIMEYLKSDKENEANQSQEYKIKEENIPNELEKKNTQEYNNNITESKTDSIKQKHDSTLTD